MKELLHFFIIIFLQFLHIVEIGQKAHDTKTSRPPVPCVLQILTTFNLYSDRPRVCLPVKNKQKVRQATVKISRRGWQPPPTPPPHHPFLGQICQPKWLDHRRVNISKHSSISVLFFMISVSCFVVFCFCWIFVSNCPGGGVLARFFYPRGRDFAIPLCLRVGISPFQKIPLGFTRRGWSGLELTDTSS